MTQNCLGFFFFSRKKRNDCGDFVSAVFSEAFLALLCCFVFPSLACRVSFPSVTTQNPAAIFAVEDGRPSLRGHGKQHCPPHRFYNALINAGVVASLVWNPYVAKTLLTAQARTPRPTSFFFFFFSLFHATPYTIIYCNVFSMPWLVFNIRVVQ